MYSSSLLYKNQAFVGKIKNMDMVFYIISVLVIVFGSMVLHEIAHGLVAFWLGDDTAKVKGRISLNPIRHIDPFLTLGMPLILAVGNLLGASMPIFGGAKPVPINTMRLKWNEWGLALVSISGPATNFILAFLFFTLWVFSYGAVADFAVLGVQINLGFMIFNLLPIPPLDGSRVIYALAPDGIRRVMEQMERYGLIIVFMLIIFFGGVFGSLMGGGIGAIINLFALLFGLDLSI